MSSEPKTLSVTIFGSEYKIKGADPAYIQEVAAYVDGKKRELEGRLSTGTPTVPGLRSAGGGGLRAINPGSVPPSRSRNGTPNVASSSAIASGASR